ncbi:MAG: M56 family metallopeptidase [Acidobacteriota bacterium]|jgi:beta-lactamase regulating signal transducer with metallopeptidase domain
MDWLINTVARGASPEVVNGVIAVSVKAALLLCVALAGTAMLRRASASVRHRVLVFTLFAVLALPALTLALPSWQVAWLPSTLTSAAPLTAAAPAPEEFAARPGVATLMAPDEGRGAPTGAPQAGAPEPSSMTVADPAQYEDDTHALGQASTPAAAGDDGVSSSTGSFAVAWTLSGVAKLLLAVWLVGTILLLARLALSAAAAWWLARSSEPVSDAEWLRLADEVRRELDLHHEVRLVSSDRISMPMAWGALRPAVLLPGAARHWTAERRKVVLLHEMAHLKRRDCQTLLLARLVTALHWMNPLSWTATRLLQSERERACDDLVLCSGTSGADYAQHLLEIARAMSASHRPGWATVAMARPSELEGRLLAILDNGRARDHGGRTVTLAAVLAIGMLVLPLAALQPSALAQEQDIDGGGAQKIKTRVVTDVELQHRFDMQLQRMVKLQFDLQPRVNANVNVQLPINVETAISQGTVQGLAAGLAEALPVTLSQDQQSTIDPRVIQAFITALQDDDAEIRAQAANSLGNIESDEAVGVLSDVLRTDADAKVREQAAWALGMIESDEAVPVLLEALSDDSGQVREQAVWALGMIESADAVSGLVGALRSDASPQVRQQAAWALGMIEDEAALEPLLDALTDDNTEVRKTVLWAVSQISG